MVLGGGPFGRWLGHEGGALRNKISVLTETQRAPSPLLPCEDTVERWTCRNQEAGPHWTLNLPVSSSWTPQPLELWGINTCYSSPPVCGVSVIAAQMDKDTHGGKWFSWLHLYLLNDKRYVPSSCHCCFYLIFSPAKCLFDILSLYFGFHHVDFSLSWTTPYFKPSSLLTLT